jgi:S-adenosylhomocysteine hydrolase
MNGFDSKVANIELADWGRKEMQLAEVEMPGIYIILFSFISLTCSSI